MQIRMFNPGHSGLQWHLIDVHSDHIAALKVAPLRAAHPRDDLCHACVQTTRKHVVRHASRGQMEPEIDCTPDVFLDTQTGPLAISECTIGYRLHSHRIGLREIIQPQNMRCLHDLTAHNIVILRKRIIISQHHLVRCSSRRRWRFSSASYDRGGSVKFMLLVAAMPVLESPLCVSSRVI